jgi:hypothetical protein
MVNGPTQSKKHKVFIQPIYSEKKNCPLQSLNLKENIKFVLLILPRENHSMHATMEDH